jgi:F-type H+-transporting ATPase subunit b
MQIDWITVSAQIVNFLILVWLLHRFLYQPVIRAMDRREQRVAERLNNAEQREQQAQEQRLQYENKVQELSRQREAILLTAKEEAEQEKLKLLDQAREEVNEQRKHWQWQMEQEKQEFLSNLRHQGATAIQSIARKALSDLANVKLEEHIVEAFIQRLKSLDKESRKTFSDSSGPMRIATVFELDASDRGRITRAVHDYIAEGMDTEYTQSPELLCGIEMSSGARQLSWNLADYLNELAGRVEQAFAPVEAAPMESAQE